MGDISLFFLAGYKEIHVEKFAPEVRFIHLGFQYRFIEFLYVMGCEFFWQKIESDGFMSHLVLEVLKTAFQYLIMVVWQARNFMDPEPPRVSGGEACVEGIIVGIDQGIIGYSDDSFAGVPAHITKGAELFQKNTGNPCK